MTVNGNPFPMPHRYDFVAYARTLSVQNIILSNMLYYKPENVGISCLLQNYCSASNTAKNQNILNNDCFCSAHNITYHTLLCTEFWSPGHVCDILYYFV